MLRARGVLAALLALTVGCGGGNPAQPSGGGGGGGSTPNFGTLTAVIDGVAYTGIINSARITNGTLGIASNSADLTRAISFAGKEAAVGTTTVSAATALSMNVITTTGTTVTGSWAAAGQFGSGTLTISSLSATGASGTFNFSAPPAPGGSGAGATGTKVVTNGAFTARF